MLQLQEDVAGALTLTSEDLSGRDEGGRGRDGRRKVVLEKDLPLLNGLESLREAEFFRSAESFEFGVREEEDARVRQDGELSFAFDEVLDILLELLPIQPFKLGAELGVAKKKKKRLAKLAPFLRLVGVARVPLRASFPLSRPPTESLNPTRQTRHRWLAWRGRSGSRTRVGERRSERPRRVSAPDLDAGPDAGALREEGVSVRLSPLPSADHLVVAHLRVCGTPFGFRLRKRLSRG